MMATVYIPPPSVEDMLDAFVQWMAHHARAKISVKIEYENGTHKTLELDYRLPCYEVPNV